MKIRNSMIVSRPKVGPLKVCCRWPKIWPRPENIKSILIKATRLGFVIWTIWPLLHNLMRIPKMMPDKESKSLLFYSTFSTLQLISETDWSSVGPISRSFKRGLASIEIQHKSSLQYFLINISIFSFFFLIWCLKSKKESTRNKIKG